MGMTEYLGYCVATLQTAHKPGTQALSSSAGGWVEICV